MDKETIEAKIRNLITPVYNLIAILEEYKDNPKELGRILINLEYSKDLEYTCNKFIELGQMIDNNSLSKTT